MAAFQVITIGRFWVITEGDTLFLHGIRSIPPATARGSLFDSEWVFLHSSRSTCANYTARRTRAGWCPFKRSQYAHLDRAASG